MFCGVAARERIDTFYKLQYLGHHVMR